MQKNIPIKIEVRKNLTSRELILAADDEWVRGSIPKRLADAFSEGKQKVVFKQTGIAYELISKDVKADSEYFVYRRV